MSKAAKRTAKRVSATKAETHTLERAQSGEGGMLILPREGVTVRGAIAVALVVALVLFQGGYYAGATCVIGLVATIGFVIYALVRSAWRSVSVAAACLTAVALIYLLSAIVHGPSLTMMQDAATWFACAGMGLWCAFESPACKRWSLCLMAWAGVVLAAVGLLMFAGIIPFAGAVNAGRLMFTFQYANTAGLFFGVCALLCLCSGVRVLAWATIVPVLALLCTQSGGAIAVTALALVIVGARAARKRTVPTAAVAGAAVGIVAVACVACWLMQARIVQATQTLIERFIQMADAGALLVSDALNLLIGIGPDQWQFVFPYVQSAQYRAAAVHNSYLQMALDGGIVVLVCVVAIVVVGIIRAAKRGEFAATLCAGMVAVHALIDFDLMFSSMVVLMAMLLASSGKPTSAQAAQRQAGQLGKARTQASKADAKSAGKARVQAAQPQAEQSGAALPQVLQPDAKQPGASHLQGAKAAVLCAIVMLMALVGAAGGIYLDVQAGALQNAYARADATNARALVADAPYLASDKMMQVYALGASYRAGEFEQVIDSTEGVDANDWPADNIMLFRAIALAQTNRDAQSCQAFAELLHAQPYNVELYKAVHRFITESDLDAAYAKAYNAEAARANALAKQGHAAWLANQETIELASESEES